MEFKRTDGQDIDFINNCRLLDIELDRRVGKEVQDKQYRKFNQPDNIRQAIVVYEDNRPVGGGAIRRHDADAVELKRVFVHPDWQKKGIGTGLVSRLVEWARELGYSRVILESAKVLTEAHALYRKLGFELIPNYAPYTDMAESICMAKQLNKS